MSSNPFDTNASDYDKVPFCLTIAKKCSKAIADEVGNELNPEKTEVLDFACGTGNVLLYLNC
jgi:ubiquinone/menaquinone biosynthesis C-methylase UbiE